LAVSSVLGFTDLAKNTVAATAMTIMLAMAINHSVNVYARWN
jgi:hypothetical protein